MQTESQSQAERYASCPYNVVEKQTAKYENMERKVTEVMGGTVLNYRSKELYLEAYKVGWESSDDYIRGRKTLKSSEGSGR